MKSRIFTKTERLWILAALTLVVVGEVLYGAHFTIGLEKENIQTLTLLATTTDEKIVLIKKIREQQKTLDAFHGQIETIGNKVGVLEKIKATDKELLKKYSKVYFLNENYIPVKLVPIDEDLVYAKSTNFLVHSQVKPFLQSLIYSAKNKGIDLLVASAYRSFDSQSSLKSEYKVLYGAGTANSFSADQGYSEHQLGTTVDFTTTKVGGTFTQFVSDPAYAWLIANAYKYGFILSYPENNTYYKYEPWHWRFVGVELATRLHNEGKFFYDLDQRDIDSYLVRLFD